MMKRKAAGRPQAGRFRRISRAGTSSVVEAYTSLSHSFGALAISAKQKKAPHMGGTVLTPAEVKFRGGGAAPLLV